jgi:hypothetical protein
MGWNSRVFSSGKAFCESLVGETVNINSFQETAYTFFLASWVAHPDIIPATFVGRLWNTQWNTVTSFALDYLKQILPAAS